MSLREPDLEVVHTVGSDCAIGTTTVTLEPDAAARSRGARPAARSRGPRPAARSRRPRCASVSTRQTGIEAVA
jgi:uncharacterized NAD-dependent epimerase/dehydratase family protein